MDQGRVRDMRRFVVLGVTCYLIFLADFMQFQLSGYAVEIMPRLGIGTPQFSSLLTAPMLTAVFVSIPLGVLADRIGFKQVVLVANLLALCGVVLRFFASSYALYFAAMVLMGLSPASINANLIKIFGVWFDEHISLAMGAFYASSSLGIVASMLSAGVITEVQDGYLVTLAAFVLGIVLWAVLVHNRPRGRAAVPQDDLLVCLGVVGRNRHVWAIGLAMGLELASTTAFIGFLPQFLETQRGLTLEEAGIIGALFTVGGIVGCALAPALFQRVRRWKPTLLAAIVTGGALLLVSWGAQEGAPALMLLTGAVTTMVGPLLEALPYSLEGLRERYAGSAGGLISMVSMAMAFVVPTALAALCGTNYPLLGTLFAATFTVSVCLVATVPSPRR